MDKIKPFDIKTTDLTLESYDLVGTMLDENAEKLEVNNMRELEEIDNRINEVIVQYNDLTVEQVQDIESDFRTRANFIEELKKSFENGKIPIKTERFFMDITEKVPDATSLESEIVRAGEKVGMRTRHIINNAQYGNYVLSSMLGMTYNVFLADIHDEETYKRMLKNNKVVEVTYKLRELTIAQELHRNTQGG